MSGFDKAWLELREAVDVRSRDQTLLLSAIAALDAASGQTILDIGCGTGSTYRTLAPRLRENFRWRLVDNDHSLLEEARLRHGDAVEIVQADLNDIGGVSFAEVGLVTASALFDLCSEDFIRRLARRLSETGIGLYAALNYDGGMSWSQPHPLDAAVTASFNAHQLSDKGLGQSLGPKAWQALADCMETYGYQVRVSESPWLMTAAEADLQRLFLNGVASALMTYGELDEADIRDWLDFRHRMIERNDCLCRVGHQDVLAMR